MSADYDEPTEPLKVADHEGSLLGAAMSGADIDAIDVEPDEFYAPANGDVWAAIRRVHAAGNRPDPVSVRLALADRNPPIDPLWLFDLTQRAPVIANAPYYAAKVREAAGLRAIASAGVQLQQLGSTPGDLAERREQARQVVDDACRGRVQTAARPLAVLVDEAIDAAERGKSPVLGTGWPDIDRLIGGLAPGRLVLVGARPGGGKSITGTNLALHFAGHHKHAALIASLEMPEAEVVNRLIAAQARVNLTKLEAADLSESEWQAIAHHRADLAAMPITVTDDASLTVQGLRRIARDVQRDRDDLALIVVDYLQLISPGPSRRNVNRSEEVSAIARGLKLLARETGACVVAMVQINREGAQEHGPRLTDIREGGAENDADQVLLLHRPDPDIPEVTVTVAKNRHGPTGHATLALWGHHARLSSVDYRYRKEPHA